jgi:hypothetical protein
MSEIKFDTYKSDLNFNADVDQANQDFKSFDAEFNVETVDTGITADLDITQGQPQDINTDSNFAAQDQTLPTFDSTTFQDSINANVVEEIQPAIETNTTTSTAAPDFTNQPDVTLEVSQGFNGPGNGTDLSVDENNTVGQDSIGQTEVFSLDSSSGSGDQNSNDVPNTTADSSAQQGYSFTNLDLEGVPDQNGVQNFMEKYQVGERFTGLLQAGGGVLEFAGGLALFDSELTAPLGGIGIIHGLDQAQNGFDQFIDPEGDPASFTQRGLEGMGVSPDIAYKIDTTLGFAFQAGTELGWMANKGDDVLTGLNGLNLTGKLSQDGQTRIIDEAKESMPSHNNNQTQEALQQSEGKTLAADQYEFTENSIDELFEMDPHASPIYDPSRLLPERLEISSENFGELIGGEVPGNKKLTGHYKFVYEYGDNIVAAISKSGDYKLIEKEISSLEQLNKAGLKVVNYSVGRLDGTDQPVIMMQRYAGSSRGYEDIQRYYNANSIADLNATAYNLKENKIYVSDLQFLIGPDGGLAINDPAGVKFLSDTKNPRYYLETNQQVINGLLKNINNSFPE